MGDTAPLLQVSALQFAGSRSEGEPQVTMQSMQSVPLFALLIVVVALAVAEGGLQGEAHSDTKMGCRFCRGKGEHRTCARPVMKRIPCAVYSSAL